MGIFDKTAGDLFRHYRVRMQYKNQLMGGVPMATKTIEGWLRTKAGVEKAEELRRAMLRTLRDIGAEVSEDMDYDALVEASDKVALSKNTNGFKIDPATGFISVESRTIKSMLREGVSARFAGHKWGQRTSYNGKGARSLFNESVFVNPVEFINIGHLNPDGSITYCTEPDGMELIIGHPQTARGITSNLTYVQFVRCAVIEFEVLVVEDLIPAEAWPDLWIYLQENGHGALRSQGFGRFDIEQWDADGGGRKIKVRRNTKATGEPEGEQEIGTI